MLKPFVAASSIFCLDLKSLLTCCGIYLGPLASPRSSWCIFWHFLVSRWIPSRFPCWSSTQALSNTRPPPKPSLRHLRGNSQSSSHLVCSQRLLWFPEECPRYQAWSNRVRYSHWPCWCNAIKLCRASHTCVFFWLSHLFRVPSAGVHHLIPVKEVFFFSCLQYFKYL